MNTAYLATILLGLSLSIAAHAAEPAVAVPHATPPALANDDPFEPWYQLGKYRDEAVAVPHDRQLPDFWMGRS